MAAAPKLAAVVLLASGCTGIVSGPTPAPTETTVPPDETTVPPDGVQTTAECAEVMPLPSGLSRFPNRRVSNAIRDLLDLSEAPRLTNGGGTYDTLIPGDARDLTTAMGFEYAEVARQAAAAADLSILAPCAPGAVERDCAGAFIDQLVPRGFRRPLVDGERERLLSVYDVGRLEQDYAAGVRLVLEAVLQSPSFLYRRNFGVDDTRGGLVLTSFEVASELGLLLLDSLPDSGLMAAAAEGRLADPDGVAGEVERLLSTEAARSNLSTVFNNWFGAEKIVGRPKDATLFPEFTAELTVSLQLSKELFIADLLQKDGTLDELYSSAELYVDPIMATFLGVPAPTTEGFGKQVLGTQQAGILTHPAVQGWLASTNETSVVHRGLFVFTQVLCQQTAPPPAGALELAAAETKELTTERQRSDYRAGKPLCAGCHVQFDGYGLAFENYDPIGRYRDTLQGAPVDANVTLNAPASLIGAVNGPGELSQRLVQNPDVASCAAQQVLAYSLARGIASEAERCAVADVAGRFRALGGRLTDLFRAVASSPTFTQRTRGDQ